MGIDLRLHAYAPGGISRYARRLALALSQMLTQDMLILLYHHREQNPLHLPHANAHHVWTPPHHRVERWSLSLELLPLKLDVLHSTDFIPPAWGARRHVITVHDLNFLHYPQYLTAEARQYYNHQIAWAVQHAHAILADSHATRRDLVQLLHVPPAQVTVTHLAADACFRPLPVVTTHEVLTRYQLDPGYLLFVGTWEPRKNLPGLLEALALLKTRGESRVLVIAGRPGWLYDEIFACVKALHLETWVRFIEEVPLEDLIALYNGALLLAMPSFYEGFGLPALEAMQCGTPVVVANRASLPEIVGDAGLCIDPEDPEDLADACWRIARDTNLAEQLQQAGQARAQQFTWAHTARQTLDVYQQVLSS